MCKKNPKTTLLSLWHMFDHPIKDGYLPSVQSSSFHYCVALNFLRVGLKTNCPQKISSSWKLAFLGRVDTVRSIISWKRTLFL